MTISPARHDLSFESVDEAELLIKEARRKGRRRRLKIGVLLVAAATIVTVLVLLVEGGIPIGSSNPKGGNASPPTGANLSSAASPPTNQASLLYVGHGVGIAATYNQNTGCSEAFLTTDFVHWRNITPPVKNPPESVAKGMCLYVWTDASFMSPTDGWLMARNGGSTNTILRHTVDGGSTWSAQLGGNTGSNAGTETFSFVNGDIGWRQQFGTGSNGNYALQRTLNGGATWSTMSQDPRGLCTFAQGVFASASLGFASSNWQAAANPTFLLRTKDGGVSWSRLTFPVPSSLARNAKGLYGAPVFDGRNGVIPVDYPTAGYQAIYFYETKDRGLTWHIETNPVLPVITNEPLSLNHQLTSASCNLSAIATSGRAAVVAGANPSTWWVLEPGPKGATELQMLSSGGTVKAFEVTDLPATTGQIQLAALNTEDALITLPKPYGSKTTYETSDGGATWKKLALSPS